MSIIINYAIGILIGLAVGIPLGIVIGRMRKTRSDATPLLDSILNIQETSTSNLESLRQNLRLKCMYDETKIDRLIEAERERNPGGSLEELMQAAVTRWEQQNR